MKDNNGNNIYDYDDYLTMRINNIGYSVFLRFPYDVQENLLEEWKKQYIDEKRKETK